MPDFIIINNSQTETVTEQLTKFIDVSSSGPQGPPGPQGPQGPAGSGSSTLFTQSSAAATWVITHNLGRPVIAQVYVSGEGVLADLITSDDNTLTVVFSSPQVGQVIYS